MIKTFKQVHKIQRRLFSYRKTEEFDNLKSLFYKYRNIQDVNREQKRLHNLKILSEGVEKNSAHLSNLQAPEINKIDELASAKMNEIEESGLTREEILNIGEGGVKIAIDPFFQLIKSDLKVRHQLLRNVNLEYNVDNIIKFALNQDIGYDDAASGTGRRIKDTHSPYNYDQNQVLEEAGVYKKVEIEDYYRGESEPTADEYHVKEIIDVMKPLKKPIRDGERRVSINEYDIHWRNTELLSKFVSRFCSIKHKRYTRLSPVMHRKVERAIKQSRQLNLLGTYTYLKPHMQKPLRTIAEDIEDDINYDIDVETGALYKNTRKKYNWNDKNSHFRVSMNYYNKNEIIKGKEEPKELKLLKEAKDYASYLKQQYNLENDNSSIESKLNLHPDHVSSKLDSDIRRFSEEELKRAKASYEQFKNRYKDLSFTDLIDLYIAEINEDVKEIESLRQFSEEIRTGNEEESESYEDLLKQIAEIKQKVVVNDNTTSAFINNKKEKEIINRFSAN